MKTLNVFLRQRSFVNSLQIKRSLFGNHNLRRERETTIPMKKLGERDRERQRGRETERD
jgi:hypothetical protein